MDAISHISKKQDRVVEILTGFDRVVVAFSGGVDSSLVAFLAHQTLGPNALAMTSQSEALSTEDLDLTRQLSKDWGMAHRVIEAGETKTPEYLANPINRCFYCKSSLYAEMQTIAAAENFPVLLNGTNTDDLGDHRPGLEAAKEFKVRSPLVEAGLNKADVRALAHHLGLSNADKPQAACLSSRVPYGLPITGLLLGKIEQGEAFLRSLGFSQLRVRHHDTIARIEVLPEDFQRVLEQASAIETKFRTLGYAYVTLDLKGFRSGALNETLKK